jgi:hypothetical protein
MTLWDAYLLLLHRLGLGPHPFVEAVSPPDDQLPAIRWFPRPEAIRINPLVWIGVPVAFLFALMGQLSLVGQSQPYLGSAALLVGAGLLVFEVWRLGLDWRTVAPQKAQVEALMLPGFASQSETTVRWPFVIGAYLATALTFVFSANNDFNLIACSCWIASLLLWVLAFWVGGLRPNFDQLQLWLGRLAQRNFSLTVSRTFLLLIVILGISAWFRFSELNEVPIAMTSDHVEKLLDVGDILNNGKRPIFEPNNGGREPMEFYLAAALANYTGLSHLTLKLVTSMAGFIALLFIFLLAREASGDDLTGLIATLAAGIGWWPNVISRNGLRFPFAMLFAAITLWLIVRALKRDKPNEVLLAGVALGIGLYGYTPIRFVPVAVGVAFTVYGLHRWSRTVTLKLIAQFAIFAMIVVAAFMPMIRYAVDEPENFWRRTVTRITGEPGLETAPPTWQVLLDNEWNSLRMFQWTSDSAWLISPANQPALDWGMGACFFLGIALLIYRYIRYRDWLDLFLLLSVPILLLPSTLALAFPIENPSLHRSGAAIPVVFLIVALPLRVLIDYGRKATRQWWGGFVAVTVVTLLLLISAQENWTILFVRYANQYKSSVQNAPELGETVRAWADSIGDWDTVVVKAYPYWVDTRAVGYYAGRPGWNNVALELDKLDDLVNDPRPKLYILNQADVDSVAFLRRIYPQGTLAYHVSEYNDKDYLTFLVPGTSDFDESLLQLPQP